MRYTDDSVEEYIQTMLLSDRTRTARKTHTCSTCGRTIAVGEAYRRRFGLIDGTPHDNKMCLDCEATDMRGI
jgi:hypothetical protein